MRRVHPVLEGLAPTNARLGMWWVVSLIILIAGNILSEVFPVVKPYRVDLIGTYISGALLALSVASWQLDARERERNEAVRQFWKPFCTDTYIVVPSTEPQGLRDGVEERSGFTPYHDAVASSEILSFLNRHLSTTPQVIASKEVRDIQELCRHNLLLVGGPNFNDATRHFMAVLWSRYQGALFQWSSGLSGDPALRTLTDLPEDHLTRLDMSGTQPLELEVFRDIRAPGLRTPVNARGMAIWIHGLLQDGKSVLLVAGLDSAFGTLAAARYLLEPDNLIPLKGMPLVQLVVSSRVRDWAIGHVELLRTLTLSDAAVIPVAAARRTTVT